MKILLGNLLSAASSTRLQIQYINQMVLLECSVMRLQKNVTVDSPNSHGRLVAPITRILSSA